MFVREAVLIPVTIARQWGSRAALERRQLAGLRALLDHARAHVPYYRNDPAYGLEGPRSIRDLARFPIIDKSVVRARAADLLADGVVESDCRSFLTSGSTGARLKVLHDHESHDYHSAALLRRFLATRRYLPTDRLVHVRPFTPPRRLFEQFGLFRRHVLLTDQPMRQVGEQILAYRPHAIIGYPVHLRALLHELTSAELAELRRSVRLVMTESELLIPEHRAELVAAFEAPVFDEYSAFEVLNIAYDCRFGRAHLSEDRIIVEVVDDDGVPVPDGTDGRIVVTHFRERAMPLLRYDLGDVGHIDPEPCPCGRRFRTLTLSVGRTNDRVVLPDGRILYPDTFLHVAATFPGIRECFVVQDAEGRVHMRVVPDGASLEDIRDGIQSWLFDSAKGRFDVTIEEATAAPLTAGGKGRFITSEFVPPGVAG